MPTTQMETLILQKNSEELGKQELERTVDGLGRLGRGWRNSRFRSREAKPLVHNFKEKKK